MPRYAIITDLNRCTGCLACTVACKAINGVPVGNFWIKTLRVGPHPIEGGSGTYPDVEMYFLPVQTHGARICLIDAGQHLDQRRFACAIFPEQGHDFTLMKDQIYVRQRLDTRKGLMNALSLKENFSIDSLQLSHLFVRGPAAAGNCAAGLDICASDSYSCSQGRSSSGKYSAMLS